MIRPASAAVCTACRIEAKPRPVQVSASVSGYSVDPGRVPHRLSAVRVRLVGGSVPRTRLSGCVGLAARLTRRAATPPIPHALELRSVPPAISPGSAACFQSEARIPPSTYRICPVTKSEAREARNTAAPMSSSGLPQRPAGVRCLIQRSNLGS